MDVSLIFVVLIYGVAGVAVGALVRSWWVVVLALLWVPLVFSWDLDWGFAGYLVWSLAHAFVQAVCLAVGVVAGRRAWPLREHRDQPAPPG